MLRKCHKILRKVIYPCFKSEGERTNNLLSIHLKYYGVKEEEEGGGISLGVRENLGDNLGCGVQTKQ